MHPKVHCNTIYNSQDTEKPKCPQRRCGTYIQWIITQPYKKMK